MKQTKSSAARTYRTVFFSIEGLAQLCHEVKGGCSVTFTSINKPGSMEGQVYGHVTWGMGGEQQIFHNVGELLDIMTRIGRKKK